MNEDIKNLDTYWREYVYAFKLVQYKSRWNRYSNVKIVLSILFEDWNLMWIKMVRVGTY